MLNTSIANNKINNSFVANNKIHIHMMTFFSNNFQNYFFQNYFKTIFVRCHIYSESYFVRVYLCTHPSIYPKRLLQLHHVLLLNTRISG